MTGKLAELAQRLGARITQLRKRHSLTQQQLALTAQVSKAVLSAIENGLRVPSRVLVTRLCTALGLQVEQLVRDETIAPLWVDIVEADTPEARLLAAGQDLRVPKELVVVERPREELAPSTPTLPAPSADGGRTPPAEPDNSAARLWATLDDLARRQAQHEELLQGLTQAVQQLLEAGRAAQLQATRNLVGVAGQLDRIEARLEHLDADGADKAQGMAQALVELRRSIVQLSDRAADSRAGQGLATVPDQLGALDQRVVGLQAQLVEMGLQLGAALEQSHRRELMAQGEANQQRALVQQLRREVAALRPRSR